MTKKMLELEIYGRANMLKSLGRKVYERVKINPYSMIFLRKRGVGVYVPKLNKIKLGIGLVGVVVLLATPFTNWLIPFLVGWILK